MVLFVPHEFDLRGPWPEAYFGGSGCTGFGPNALADSVVPRDPFLPLMVVLSSPF